MCPHKKIDIIHIRYFLKKNVKYKKLKENDKLY